MVYKKDRRFPKIISDDELEKVLEVVEETYPQNPVGYFHKIRDSTAIKLMAFTGMRPGECLSLSWNDINFEKRLIHIDPFTNKERNDLPVVLCEDAYRLLVEYQVQIKQGFIVSKYLFPSRVTGNPITTDSFAKRFQKIVARAGLLKVDYYTESGMPVYNKRPYSLRHNFATKVFNQTGSELAVQRLARHIKPDTVHKYTHMDNEEKLKLIDWVFTNDKESLEAPRSLGNFQILKKEVINNQNITINNNVILNLLEKQQEQLNKMQETIFQIVNNKREAQV